MGMSPCYSLMKCLLIIFSILFLCVGSAACVFVAWALWDSNGNATHDTKTGLFAVAAWGGVLALGALTALCGAIRNSTKLLAAAFSLLVLSAVAEAAAVWWGAAHRPQLRQALLQNLDHMVQIEYGVMPSSTQLMDVIQQELECCGTQGPRDWQTSLWARHQRVAGREGSGHEDSGHGGSTHEGSGHRWSAHEGSGHRGFAHEGSGHVPRAALDLSVGAPADHYWVPESCCTVAGEECEAARRVAGAAGGARGGGVLRGAACGVRVLDTLARAAQGPLCALAALLAAHVLALPLALLLCLRAHNKFLYKA